MLVSDPFENAEFEEQTKALTPIPALGEMNVLYLPASLRLAAQEAFAGSACQAVIVPDRCAALESRAFADCKNLIYVSLPSGIDLAPDAFEGCDEILFIRR